MNLHELSPAAGSNTKAYRKGRGGRLVLGDPAVQALDQLDIQISHCKSPP